MSTTNEIILRPRFKKQIRFHHEVILKHFGTKNKENSPFVVTRIDDHVFIKYPKAQQKFWTPELHLEITYKDEQTAELHGLYGPSPTVWTLFMFLHFLVGTVFVIFAVWAYTNWKLNYDYYLQMLVCALMVMAWITLYVAGRIGKTVSKKEMHELKNFMETTISEL
jgi:hypothetical protein